MPSTSNSSNVRKKLVILCDGTWCGRETGTDTNISMLATKMGNPASTAVVDTQQPFKDESRNMVACYFPGAGLGGTFLSYLFNGATGGDIGKECKDVYQYIVENFDSETDIWMFGHSRGSYTVRCVGGMINNCGIIKKRGGIAETSLLIDEVYDMYRSPYEGDKPNSPKSQKFMEKASWSVATPIKFMGLIDTVGSLGIPQFNAGVGFDWPQFYDQVISSSVGKVYHAVSLHDRLWMFEPCRARRKDELARDPNFAIQERWFPGCHYDVGRQRFKFFRDGVNVIEKMLFALPNRLTKPVMPNTVCADLVLLWMLEAIKANDTHNQLLKDGVSVELAKVQTSLASTDPDTGSGDVYSNVIPYNPFGFLGTAVASLADAATKVVDWLSPNVNLGTALQQFLGVKTILDALLATRDRRIESWTANVYPLNDQLAILGGSTVHDKAKLGRYLSKTLERWSEVVQVVRN